MTPEVERHLTFVESLWFEGVVAGRATRGTRSMQVDSSTTLRKLRADYRAACTASNEIIAGLGDGDAPVASRRRR